MVVVLSDGTSSLMEGGMEACSMGSRAFTRSTVSITLAPGWRWIRRMMAGLPSVRPALRRSCTESSTVAISARRTGAPLRYATMMGR
jgi:hypothetical protein